MEATASLRSSGAICCGSGKAGFFSAHTAPEFVRFGFRPPLSSPCMKLYPFDFHLKSGNQRVAYKSGRYNSIRASLPPSRSGDSTVPIAPLQFESPVGQFLSQVIINHPHLVPAAVDQQLQQLMIAQDAHKDEPSVSGTELVLYRRIAEVKAKERRKALEEILYAMVVQKFMDGGVPLIPAINLQSSPDSSPARVVDAWSIKNQQLLHLHSPDAYEMIQNHLALILGDKLGDNNASAIQINKFRVGQVYAASVMYGYFLKRVVQRFQLEKTVKILPQRGVGRREASGNLQAPEEEVLRSGNDENNDDNDVSFSSTESSSHPEVNKAFFSSGFNASRLKSYVMSLDAEILQAYASIRSKEAIQIIEKHTEALFGRPEVAITRQGTIDFSKEEMVMIRFSGLKRLILEALTFGSFLWDVESYVDLRYHFVTHH
ncbi:unnamed protein product [Cuscuta epithymum]|uniref:UV-B-induced protein At3g17800, chloroplastic-like n=1 Tax=Cuscuta epithymum TaxID=186058 RepID=A0AAV0E8E6_9ASTE|nr:unnamed protein product [Cuscuta epithymum]